MIFQKKSMSKSKRIPKNKMLEALSAKEERTREARGRRKDVKKARAFFAAIKKDAAQLDRLKRKES